MKKMFKFLAVVAALAMAFAPAALAACGGGGDTPPPAQSETVNVTGVTLTAAGSATSLQVGKTLQLTATISPSNATNKAVTYSTSASSVATVSASGLVTGVAAGNVTITVTTAEGSFKDTVELTVVAADEPVTEVTSVAVAPSDAIFAGNVVAGGSVNLTASVAPEGATDKALTWTAASGQTDATSSLEAQADGSYTFTPQTAGEYTVRATSANGVYGEYSLDVFAARTTLTGENAQLIGCSYNTAEGCIGGIQKGVAVITFTVESAVAQTVTLQAGLAITSEADASFSKQFSVTVNKTPVAPESDTMFTKMPYGWSNNGTVSISGVNLIAGHNTIVFTHGTDVNTNMYYLSIFGDEQVTEVQPQAEDPITEGTDNIFEGETAVMTAGSMGPITVNNSDANAHGGTSLANTNSNAGATLTFTVKSEQACKAGLYASLAFGAKTVSGIFALTVNGKPVNIPGSFDVQDEENWSAWTTYEEYWLANIDLIAGENTIVLTVTGGCGNFDYINILAPGVVTEVVPEPEDPITEGTDNIFEGETAVMTAGSMGVITVNNSDANAHGGTSLGNANNNNGATLTFTVNSAQACKAGLYASLAFGAKTVGGIFTLTVNGKPVNIPGSFDVQDEENWSAWTTYEEYWLANIDLIAGENIIVLTVTGGCGNFDYINIIAPCAVTAADA